jgi:hypothetical protein
MAKAMEDVRVRTGQLVRVSHAKAHGFLTGELVIAEGLPPELAQGLFARPGRHPALVRISQSPGEVLDDRKVSTARGMAIKVFDVEGDKLPGHAGNTTQDFVLQTGKTFLAKNAKQFKAQFAPNTLAPKLPEAVKGAVSDLARGANAALHAAGADSVHLDFYGHPHFHPLGEAYYSQAPIRYGDYVAKLGVTPGNAPLEALFETKIDLDDENALRLATREYFRTNSAELNVQVQLATDLDKTPIEDPTVAWPEDVTPYRTVARLILPVQDAWDEERVTKVNREISFFPGHALAAHRPMGQVMRARLAVYPQVAGQRRMESGVVEVEPRSLAEVIGKS